MNVLRKQRKRGRHEKKSKTNVNDMKGEVRRRPCNCATEALPAKSLERFQIMNVHCSLIAKWNSDYRKEATITSIIARWSLWVLLNYDRLQDVHKFFYTRQRCSPMRLLKQKQLFFFFTAITSKFTWRPTTIKSHSSAQFAIVAIIRPLRSLHTCRITRSKRLFTEIPLWPTGNVAIY